MYSNFDSFSCGIRRVCVMNYLQGAPASNGKEVGFGRAFFGLVDDRWELLRMPSFDSDALIVCESKSFKFVGRNRVKAWAHVDFPFVIPTFYKESE